MDFSSRLVLHTSLGTGNDVVAGSGKQKASAWRAKGTMGYSDNICYLPWLAIIFVVSP